MRVRVWERKRENEDAVSNANGSRIGEPAVEAVIEAEVSAHTLTH